MMTQDILKIPVVITKTGVKHLHHAALQFDIGIYFEANGHGTVLFGDKYYELLAQCTAASSTTAATGILSALPKLIHPAVGDALSDFLLVDAFLGRLLQWSLADWNTQLYTDLPSRQLKVQVADRSVVKCNANETMCLEPAGLQPALDRLLTKELKGGRCFVRASGTENVVRVYAEAKTRAQAQSSYELVVGSNSANIIDLLLERVRQYQRSEGDSKTKSRNERHCGAASQQPISAGPCHPRRR
jgi:phosphoacetylglucosamine mutase